ncbi:MAG TPA: sugar ABC transporter permease [Chloroflexi bacterium]|nr:sugar ABC transporter permease [Chloroflexota bacterium]
MLDDQAPKWVTTLVAIAVGVCGVWIFFWIFNEIISLIPGEKARERLRPLVFVGPALALLIIYLIYPAINTIYLSFFDARSENFVGLKNYAFIFTSPQVQVAFRNNILWIVVVTSVCVTLGLIIAVLVDRIQLESIAKSIIFLPMAISSVGASIIWRFVYAYQPAGRAQIGILNAIVVALGGQPVGWFLRPPLNNFALMVIMIWLQTGFCMVVISAALKAVPGELLEAARIDGANEFQAFLRVTVPYIKGTLITVGTTVLIAVLKVFDIVYVMTRGNFNTEVIANRMFLEMYRFYNFGRGSALAVLLFLAVAPVMIINVRNLRRQRS